MGAGAAVPSRTPAVAVARTHPHSSLEPESSDAGQTSQASWIPDRDAERSQGSSFCSPGPRGSLGGCKVMGCRESDLGIPVPNTGFLCPGYYPVPLPPSPRPSLGEACRSPSSWSLQTSLTRAGGAGPSNHQGQADSSVLFLGPRLKTRSSKALEDS